MQTKDDSENQVKENALSPEDVVLQQVCATKKDLTQVKSLIDNAIEGLVDSFISLEASVRIQQNFIKVITSGENTTEYDERNPFKNHHIKSKQLIADVVLQTQNLAQESEAMSLHSDLDLIKKSITNIIQNLSNVAHNQNNNQTTIVELQENLARINHITSELQVRDAEFNIISKRIEQKIGEISQETSVNVQLVSEEMQNTNQQIERDVLTAISSLQFQDTSTQLIAQCIDRQSISEKFLQILQAKRSTNNSNPPEDQQAMDIDNMIAEINQTHMKEFDVGASSVDLFD